jgi:hypothetical protein
VPLIPQIHSEAQNYSTWDVRPLSSSVEADDKVDRVDEKCDGQLDAEVSTSVSRINSRQDINSEWENVDQGYEDGRAEIDRKASRINAPSPGTMFNLWSIKPEIESRVSSGEGARPRAFRLSSKIEGAIPRGSISWREIRQSIGALEEEYHGDQTYNVREELENFCDELEADRAEFLRGSMDVVKQIIREEFEIFQEEIRANIREAVKDEFRRARREHIQEARRRKVSRVEVMERPRKDMSEKLSVERIEQSEAGVAPQQLKRSEVAQPEREEELKAKNAAKKKGMFFLSREQVKKVGHRDIY